MSINMRWNHFCAWRYGLLLFSTYIVAAIAIGLLPLMPEWHLISYLLLVFLLVGSVRSPNRIKNSSPIFIPKEMHIARPYKYKIINYNLFVEYLPFVWINTGLNHTTALAFLREKLVY